MPDIFVNYRHDDGHAAGRLKDRLDDEFAIFFDTGVEVGEDIEQVTSAALKEVRVFIAIIGKEWFSARNLERLQKPTDWIYREISQALLRNGVDPEFELMPVLVDKSITMPRPDQLPEALRRFSDIKAIELNYEAWDITVDYLVKKLHGLLGKRSGSRSRAIAMPSDIPYLCDRVQQQQDFEDLALQAQARKSLVCILDGHKYEAHSGFVKRLQQRRIFEKAFGASGTGVDVFPLEWSPREAREHRYEDLLRSAIKRSAMKSLGAKDEDLLKFLRNGARPAILMLQLSWSDLEEYGRSLLTDLSRAWDNIIAQLDGAPSQALLLWINLSYEDAGQEIEAANLPRLEKLAPVRQSDIETWLSYEEVRSVVAGHESTLLNIASDPRYCISPGKVHMLRFVEATRELLGSEK